MPDVVGQPSMIAKSGKLQAVPLGTTYAFCLPGSLVPEAVSALHYLPVWPPQSGAVSQLDALSAQAQWQYGVWSAALSRPGFSSGRRETALLDTEYVLYWKALCPVDGVWCCKPSAVLRHCIRHNTLMQQVLDRVTQRA